VLRHVVLMRFIPNVTTDQVDELTADLLTLPGSIAEIKAYSCGRNVGEANKNWHFAVVAEFATSADHEAYLTNERHLEVIATRIHPILAERAAVQYEF